MVSIYEWALSYLNERNVDSPEFELKQLKMANSVQNHNTEKDFISKVKRRGNGEPLQYILGEWEFMSLPFICRRNVLIPRPDTEILVETALEMLDDKPAKVLDLCCGSGCIGISIAHYNKNVHVVCADISDHALKLTKENAELNNTADKIKIVKQDIFQDKFNDKFNMIISNPPYIKQEEISQLQKEVADFEPHLALDGGSDGLEFYKTICKNYYGNLIQNGALLFEIGINMEKDVIHICSGNGYRDIRVINDYNGINRVVTAKK